MGDLIIKPATGGQLKIKNPAGIVKLSLDSDGNIATSTANKIKQKGAFMQSSTHQALVLGY